MTPRLVSAYPPAVTALTVDAASRRPRREVAGPIRAELADALARAAAAVEAGDVDAARAWCRCATAVADGWHVALLPRDAASAWCREVAT